MIDPKLIKRINELAALSRERELTQSEKREQQRLRAEYLKQFREGFKQQLDSIEFVDDKKAN